MTDVKWVVAGNYQEYVDWLHGNGYDRRQWRYVSGADDLRGHTDPHGIFIGRYYIRPDITQILQQLQISTHGTNPVLQDVWRKVELYAR